MCVFVCLYLYLFVCLFVSESVCLCLCVSVCVFAVVQAYYDHQLSVCGIACVVLTGVIVSNVIISVIITRRRFRRASLDSKRRKSGRRGNEQSEECDKSATASPQNKCSPACTHIELPLNKFLVDATAGNELVVGPAFRNRALNRRCRATTAKTGVQKKTRRRGGEMEGAGEWKSMTCPDSFPSHSHVSPKQ